MNRVLIGLVIIVAVLISTNPTRADFNAWAQSYVASKIEQDAIRRGEDPNDGRREFGGALFGLVVANLPIERQNYLALSLYTIRLPDGNGGDRACTFVGIAGQFVPTKGCNLHGSPDDQG